MTDFKDSDDNSPSEDQKARIHKATGTFKHLLKEAQAKRFTGAVSIMMPVDSGRMGTYRTLVLPVRES